MKSLRKIAVRRGICLFAATLVSGGFVVAAQTPTNPDGAEQGTSSGGAAKPSSAPAAPQTPAQPGRQGTIVTRTTLVTVPVTVKYRDGRLVPDLHRDEFRLFEDNVEQKITSFTAEAFPLSMVVLIDNDLKSKDAEQVESSIKAVLGGMSVADEASICRFDQFFHEGKGFSANQDRLLTEL